MSWKVSVIAVFLGFVQILQCQNLNLDFITSDGKAVSEATKHFPATLYHATKDATKGNFVISPFSIGNVLSMLREGSNGLTREELNLVMRYQSLSDNTISNGFHDILYSLHENKDSIMKISNRIYVTNAGKIKPEFSDILQLKYFTKVLPSNFIKSQEVADDINRWAHETTHGKITNLINADSIDRNTKAIVANAIYFKGKWIKEFNIKGTRQQMFIDDEGNATMTEFMEQEDAFPHVELTELSASAIAMPYEGNRFNLIVILPNEGVKLKDVEEKLKRSNNGQSFTEIPSKMSRRSIHLTFPKFRMETEIDFTQSGILKNLGLKDAMTPGKADFSFISSEERIHVDQVIQKCFIDITEEGTEAAAATFAKIVPFSIRRSIAFRVTKPFIAYIFDSVTKTVLFTIRKATV